MLVLVDEEGIVLVVVDDVRDVWECQVAYHVLALSRRVYVEVFATVVRERGKKKEREGGERGERGGEKEGKRQREREREIERRRERERERSMVSDQN